MTAFEVIDQRGKVGHSIDGTLIEMYPLKRDTGIEKDWTRFFRDCAGRNPNLQGGMYFSKLGRELFSFWISAQGEDGLGVGGLMVGDRQSYRNDAQQQYEQGTADPK